MVSSGFSAYKIISSANEDNFTSTFQIWMPFSCLVALARTSTIIEVAKAGIFS